MHAAFVDTKAARAQKTETKSGVCPSTKLYIEITVHH